MGKRREGKRGQKGEGGNGGVPVYVLREEVELDAVVKQPLDVTAHKVDDTRGESSRIHLPRGIASIIS